MTPGEGVAENVVDVEVYCVTWPLLMVKILNPELLLEDDPPPLLPT